MKIEHYSFGKIVIDRKTFTSDVIIYPDRIDPSWWRREGHSLDPVDLVDVVAAKPEILIIGTGNSGMMVVPEMTLAFLGAKGLDVRVGRTGEAVDLFNEMQGGKKVIAALHLTC